MLPEDLTNWHAYFRILHGDRHGEDSEEEALDLTEPSVQDALLAQFGEMAKQGKSVRIEHG